LLGTAAALTDGRITDGCVDLTFARGSSLPVELKDHFVFRLTTPTLVPVARRGDLLLVRDHAKATPLSLVIALHENRLLARRLRVADNHSDVAVLTASAINPRLTAAPVVAKLSTLSLLDDVRWETIAGVRQRSHYARLRPPSSLGNG
jgi:hypothetical protein